MKVAEGSATVALRMAEQLPTYGSRHRSRSIAIAGTGCTVTTPTGEESGATRWCSPSPPAPPATSRSPASATSGWPRCGASGTRGQRSSSRPTTGRSGATAGRTASPRARACSARPGRRPRACCRRWCRRSATPRSSRATPTPATARRWPRSRAVRRPGAGAAADLDPALGHRPVDPGLRHQLAARRRGGRRAVARHPRAAVLRVRLGPVGGRLHGGRGAHRTRDARPRSS